MVDALGLLLMVVVHAANIQDRDGAKLVLNKIKGRFPRLRLIWADGGYAGKLVDWVKTVCHWVLEVGKRREDVKGFQVLPRRWSGLCTGFEGSQQKRPLAAASDRRPMVFSR